MSDYKSQGLSDFFTYFFVCTAEILRVSISGWQYQEEFLFSPSVYYIFHIQYNGYIFFFNAEKFLESVPKVPKLSRHNTYSVTATFLMVPFST
jgi:hypothetical protein